MISAMEKTSYSLAQDSYAALGIDTEAALKKLATIPISLHCWQGDDVGGFEQAGGELGGGLAVTGNYPGKARTPDELRADLDKTFSLIPGKHRLNLHAIYGDFGGKKSRAMRSPWRISRAGSIGRRRADSALISTGTFFSHPLADDGFTLSHPRRESARILDRARQRPCRRIGAAMGEQLGNTCVVNVWIPDGYKDIARRPQAPRERLAASLDAIFAERLDPRHNRRCRREQTLRHRQRKLRRRLARVLPRLRDQKSEDLLPRRRPFSSRPKPSPTRFPPSSSSSRDLLLHVSRGVRWDSDHVVLLDDVLSRSMEEVVRGDFLARTFTSGSISSTRASTASPPG